MTRQLVMLESLVRRAKPGRSEVELESAWLPLLMKLAEEGLQRAGEIAAALCMSPSTISRQVAVLVGSGLIERRAYPDDGRASLLAATATDRRMLDAERRRRAAQYIDALAGWPPEARGRSQTCSATSSAIFSARGRNSTMLLERRSASVPPWRRKLRWYLAEFVECLASVGYTMAGVCPPPPPRSPDDTIPEPRKEP
ncbi:MarR family winged helix-turn-helix transcriptional regulator [Saccharopolyspora shandongensis]|uniref:MarR family winged helix-turn-helix transcriptional regulator n=1 Tax=Saccharopolyspora shandongensis TaxID=418495 RepID=UPI00342B97CD